MYFEWIPFFLFSYPSVSPPNFENTLLTHNRISKVNIMGIFFLMSISYEFLTDGSCYTGKRSSLNNFKSCSCSKLEKPSYFHFSCNWVAFLLLEIQRTAPWKPHWSLYWSMLCIPMSMLVKFSFLHKSCSQFLPCGTALSGGNRIFSLAQSRCW